MKLPNTRLALLTCLLTSAGAQPPAYCQVVIYRDYDLGFNYYAVPALPKSCPEGAIGRVRKSSTLSLKSRGAEYQPIRPLTGAWTVTRYGDNVPNSEQYVFWISTWEWQTYTGKLWVKAAIK